MYLALLREGGGGGIGILGRVARGAEDILVPLFAGDGVGHRRLDDQDLLVFLGDRQHGARPARAGGADGELDVIVAVGLLPQYRKRVASGQRLSVRVEIRDIRISNTKNTQSK